MKLLYRSIAVAVFGILSFNASSQVNKEEKREVKKEVIMKETEGEKVMTISTNENGKVTEETYKGVEADKKMNELQQESAVSVQKVREEVKVEQVNGEKVVTIVRNIDGKETVEVLKGEAADAKIKEMEAQGKATNQPKPLNKSMKTVEVKKMEAKEKQ